MNSKKQTGWLSTLSIVTGLALAACGGGEGGAGSASAVASGAGSNKTASSTTKPADSNKTADTKKSADKPADSAAPADSSKVAAAEIDVDSILDSASKDPEASGALKVDLADLDDKAPSIGAAPSPKAEAPDMKWLSLGLYMMPDMGMEQEKFNDGFILHGKDKDSKGAVIITTWKDAKEVETKVTDLMKAMKIKEFKWKEKFKVVTLGPDKIPAKIAGGHATREDGKTGELGYVLIKGEPNILGVLLMKDGISKEEKQQVFSSIAFIKKQPKK